MNQYIPCLLLSIVACSLHSAIECSIVPQKGPLRSYITGGYKGKLLVYEEMIHIIGCLGIQTRNSKLAVDCNQFASDYEVLDYLPFPIMINPIATDWDKSYAEMDVSDTFVASMTLRDIKNTVPSSIFCLKNLQNLVIENMVLPDSKIYL